MSTHPMRPFFVDTDTASDDAVALMIAAAATGIDLKGIGVVAGNVPLDKGVQNALFILELYERDVPVYAGADRPLARPLETAEFVHGEDGMGDVGFPLTGRSPADGHAVDALIEAAREAGGDLELVTLGPLTNVAQALAREPELAGWIKQCTVMGGTSDYYGNITPVSEYNAWVDPDAADVVFASGMSVVMVGWDVSRKYALIDREESERLRSIGTERARVAVDCQKTLNEFVKRTMGRDAFDLPDPVTMAVALLPELVTDSFDAPVYVNTGDDVERGMTLIDHQRMLGSERRPAQIVTAVDRPRFLELLADSLR